MCLTGEVCRRGMERKEPDIRNLEKACLKLHAEGISPPEYNWQEAEVGGGVSTRKKKFINDQSV